MPQGQVDYKSGQFFIYLRLADYSRGPGDKYRVDHFIGWILRMLKFDNVDGEGRIVSLRPTLNFTIAGILFKIETDVTIVDDNDILLLVQQDKGVRVLIISTNIAV